MDEPQPVDLADLAGDLLAQAATTSARRAARTFAHPAGGLRQTVIALLGGTELSEHESPGPATLQLLRGRARLVAGDREIALTAGALVPVPSARHSLHADEDTVAVLTIAVAEQASAE
ncbi:LuxR family transcriptional regulator [Geodermatophilus sp. URMC 64]